MKEYTLFWIIENYSYYWHEILEPLTTPGFFTEVLEGTAWFLGLYPGGKPGIGTGNVALYLCRISDNGPKVLPLNFEISILTTDGKPIWKKKVKYEFHALSIDRWFKLVQIDDVLKQRKSKYLPHDTLNLQCKMWLGEGPIEKIGRSRVRTRLDVRKISFLHLVEGFSALEQNQPNIVETISRMKDEYILTSTLFCTDGSCCEEKLMLEIKSSVIKFLSECKLYLLDASRNLIECGPAKIRPEVGKYGIVKLPLSLTKQVIMAKKSEYLTDDKLSLLCECIFSTGLEFQRIEEIVYELPTIADNIISNLEATAEEPKSSTALEDIKAIYSDQFLTDVELKTKTKAFAAHKIVLCARSPVLKNTLSSVMINCDCIEIEDLEDDILNQFLLFLYCDNVENIHLEKAIKLYCAADKYEVEGLKMVCSQFLEHKLTTRTAVELLVLAEIHSISDLKQLVENFILKHDELVFGSDEWDYLIETNPKLALKTMQLKYKKLN